ncbi:MAG TPA: oligopeptide/dipeptide ABC transporter ATP-binding protein [Xanthobacteraceae bacterium]
MSEPILVAAHLRKDFRVPGGRQLRAVDDVSLTLSAGETLGVVGESGCGKSTLGRMILRLIAPSAGEIRFLGQDITHLSERALRPLRRHLQAVFQDPVSSLNPRMRVGDIIAEPLVNLGIGRADRRARVAELLEVVGLPADATGRHPHAFSGGQRQRIAIARALAASPKLIVCDEATSSLDVSVQAQILNLLSDLQARFALALFFISHNLGAVRHLAHRVAVMYLGRVVEIAPEAELFEHPHHPYTAALLAAVPAPVPDQAVPPPLRGEVPSPIEPPSGCHFHPRCARAEARCRVDAPELRPLPPSGALVRCHFPG